MQKVLLGISGGVDSSVAGFLLKKAGYDVVGVHFSLQKSSSCGGDAKRVADSLNIPLYEVDFSKVFHDQVFSKFISDYEMGETPNLCVACNRRIKFGALKKYAEDLGVELIATGHYCSTQNIDGRTFLKCPVDQSKDQTYFLNQVPESVLSKVLFPLANLTKAEVRQIAEENGLVTAHKKGSSDICLMGDMSFREFLKPYVKEKIGKIYTLDGKLVGRHTGLYNYTLGQRKGLGLGGMDGVNGRWFVVKKDVATNTLYVSHGSQDELYSNSLTIKDCNFIGVSPKESFTAYAKTRYSQNLEPCTVKIKDSEVFVEFENPQRAITQGQYCVFYKDGYCLGGGRII